MELGVSYHVDGFEYAWNGIFYKHTPEGIEEWGMVDSSSYHMEVIKLLEAEFAEVEF